jgi:hypothetical protein
MDYPIHTKDVVDYTYRTNNEVIDFNSGLMITDKVHDYLASHDASLFMGPGEISRETFKQWNNAGDWLFHVGNTTVYLEIRPDCNGRFGRLNGKMNIRFAAAGEHTKEILTDLQAIVEGIIRK